MRPSLFAIAFAISILLASPLASANDLFTPATYKTLSAELTYVRTGMNTADVELVFVDQKESYKNCANLYVWHREDSAAGHANVVTCRDGDKLLSIFVKDDEAAVERVGLSADNVQYRGGVLTFLKRVPPEAIP